MDDKKIQLTPDECVVCAKALEQLPIRVGDANVVVGIIRKLHAIRQSQIAAVPDVPAEPAVADAPRATKKGKQR